MARKSRISYQVDGLKGMIDALKQVEAPPSYKTTVELEIILQNMFVVTQNQVHIISGRLMASGRTFSDFNGKRWLGTINYGGPKPHVAYYGVYELHRRGVKPGYGPHDFFTGLEAFDPLFEKAIDTHFSPLSLRTSR